MQREAQSRMAWSSCTSARFIAGVVFMCMWVPLPGRGTPPSATPAAVVGLEGGLIVQFGADDTETPVTLGRTGRYLVDVLDPDARSVAAAQVSFHEAGIHGLVTAGRLHDRGDLPFADNVVNLAVIRGTPIPAHELFRVTAPGGHVMDSTGAIKADALQRAGFVPRTAPASVLVVRKPRPKDMDAWSHARHAADGNAASRDQLVGLPERIRWVAGAVDEVEGVVTAGGRNIYGGMLVRDSFNGLRLWNRDLRRADAPALSFRLPHIDRNLGRPVASDTFVFAVSQGSLVAIDGGTGAIAHVFEGLDRPSEIAHSGGVVLACDSRSVKAYRAETGQLLWEIAASSPRNLVADSAMACFIQGVSERGETVTAVGVSMASGAMRWQQSGLAWLPKVRRTVLYGKYLAYEVSSFNDHDAGNALYVTSSSSGSLLWEKAYPPGMNHVRQSRAMFVDDDLWILHGGKTNTAGAKEDIKRLPIRISALDPATGNTRVTYPAGLAHCFPPVVTARYFFSGVMDLTDLRTGELTLNPITKANCSRENGWVPANGLIYTTPKHCTCWPILRGFVALAPWDRRGRDRVDRPVEEIAFTLERGQPAESAPPAESPDSTADWPLYRHDPWRSSSTQGRGPDQLRTRWKTRIAPEQTLPDGPILDDWRENAYVKGLVSAPTVAQGLVFVARPDAQQVVAVDAGTGAIRWRFTADGRVDTPPTIHRGLCLFGTHAGSVYALCAATGRLGWRFRAAPTGERIVAYGQLESPWPVAGAVLVADGVAYFAAGRQSLADGGILVFALDPLTGRRHWVRRLDTIPQKGFYENSGLEFDPTDILHKEGDGIAFSRWIISRDGNAVKVDKWNAFAKLDTGGGAVWVPRGAWTYGPRHQRRFRGEAPRRPLCAFRDGTVLSSLNGSTEVFRRDFDLAGGETFKSNWITGWELSQKGKKGKNPFRTYRLAEKSTWTADVFNPDLKRPRRRDANAKMTNDVYGMALDGSGRLFTIHRDGRLVVVAVEDGAVKTEAQLAQPIWDALAIANGRVYFTTRAGELVCVGD